MKVDSTQIDTIDVGEIVLENTLGTKSIDTIKIFGDVKDILGKEIEGATILLSELRMFNDLKQEFRLNVLYNKSTGLDGTFETAVNYTPNGMKEIIVAQVAKKGYALRFVMLAVSGDEIDAGTIVIKKAVIGTKNIWNIKGINNRVQAKSVTLYSLSGKKIYSGEMLDLPGILANQPIGAQSLIIQYNILNQEKVFHSL